MRCRTCDYTLWSIRDRVCPECGAPFKPSEFLFRRSAVAYHCPHCDQSYFGMTAQGHLKPRTFNCVTCSREIDMDEMVLTPTDGVREDFTAADEKNPWEARRGFGIFGAWFRTVWMSMASPSRLIQKSSARGLAGSAVWFAAFTTILIGVASMISWVIFGLVVSGMFGGGGAMGLMFVIPFTFFYTLFGGLFVVILIMAWSLGTHMLLALSGGTERGIGRTIMAISYGSGVNVVTAIPLVGMYVALGSWVWWGVSSGLMLAETHRVSKTRAIIASITPPALMVALLVGGYIWMMGAMFRGMGGMGGMGSWQEVQIVNEALLLRLQQDDLRHAVELVADGDVTDLDFTLATTYTLPEDAMVAGRSLDEYAMVSAIERTPFIDAAAAELPDDVVAYRVGDFVFTYPGIDVNQAANQGVGNLLWLVIAWPDPNLNAPPGPNDMVWVGMADGSTYPLMLRGLDYEIDNQNGIRAQHGLPPLPHPADVLHGAPASASDPMFQEQDDAVESAAP